MEVAFSGSAGKNRKPPSTTRFLATKPQVAEAQNRGLVGQSRFYPALLESPTEVCGKFRNPRAHRPFHAEKPQVEALRYPGVLGIFRICRILSIFASVAGRVHSYHRLDNGQDSQFRLQTKTPAGAKLLLPALACLLVLFSARAEARFGPLRLRWLHAQLVADELEGCGDGLVHVVVLVAAQATGKDNVALLRRQLLVLLV